MHVLGCFRVSIVPHSVAPTRRVVVPTTGPAHTGASFSRRDDVVIADEDENATSQWRGARVVAAGVRVGTDAVARRASRREDARRRERDRTAAVTARAREA